MKLHPVNFTFTNIETIIDIIKNISKEYIVVERDNNQNRHISTDSFISKAKLNKKKNSFLKSSLLKNSLNISPVSSFISLSSNINIDIYKTKDIIKLLTILSSITVKDTLYHKPLYQRDNYSHLYTIICKIDHSAHNEYINYLHNRYLYIIDNTQCVSLRFTLYSTKEIEYILHKKFLKERLDLHISHYDKEPKIVCKELNTFKELKKIKKILSKRKKQKKYV